MTHIESAYFNGPYDGILGLGFSEISVNGIPTVFDNLINQKIIEKPTFSFWINSNINDTIGGILTLGTSDPKLYEGNLHYAKIDANDTWWRINLDGVKIGGNPNISCWEGCKALVDTGGGFNIGTDNPFAINTAIGAQYNETLDEFIVDCKDVNHLPIVELQISGHPFPLSGPDYIIKGNHCENGNCTELCTSGFQGGGAWYLGTLFRRKYFLEFDVASRRIGFAKAVHNETRQSSN